MATRRNNSIIGDYRGKLGPLVLSESYGVGTARSMPRKSKKRLSGKRKKHTATLGMVNTLLSTATAIINLGFQKPKNPKMSPFNAAVSWNFNNALSDDPVNAVLQMEKVQLSLPIQKTQKAWEASLSLDVQNNAKVAWKLNPYPHKCTHLDDRAIIVLYDAEENRFFLQHDVVLRSDQYFVRELGDCQNGHHLHWYMFMISADKKLVSETQYLGMIKLEE